MGELEIKKPSSRTDDGCSTTSQLGWSVKVKSKETLLTLSFYL